MISTRSAAAELLADEIGGRWPDVPVFVTDVAGITYVAASYDVFRVTMSVWPDFVYGQATRRNSRNLNVAFADPGLVDEVLEYVRLGLSLP